MTTWLATHEEDGAVAFRIGRDGDELVAEWIGLARLVASRDGGTHRWDAVAGADARELRKIQRGSGELLLRHARGELALHGAAIAFGSVAIGILGRSGAGKSTLAAALVSRGGALFGDDAIAVDRLDDAFVVTPLEEDHWLEPDARAALGAALGGPGKLPIVAQSTGQGRAELVAFVALAFGDAVGCRRLHGPDALAMVVPQVVRFVLDEPIVTRREMDRLADLVDAVPVYLLERPRDLARLLEVADAVVALARSPEP